MGDINFDNFGFSDEDWQMLFSDENWDDEIQFDFSDEEWAEFEAMFDMAGWDVSQSKPKASNAPSNNSSGSGGAVAGTIIPLIICFTLGYYCYRKVKKDRLEQELEQVKKNTAQKKPD